MTGFITKLYLLISSVLIAVCFLPSLQAADFPLQPGQELLSYPLTPPQALSCNNIKTQTGAESIKRLDGPSQQFEDCQTVNYFIEPGIGYLLHLLEPGLLSANGPNICPDIDFHLGVNLIGIPTPFVNMGCYDLIQSIGNKSIVSTVQRFNPDTGRYEVCAYDNNSVFLTPQGTDFPIISGEGYFVLMKQALFAVSLNDLDQCVIIQNRAPQITSSAVINATVDVNYLYQVTGSDPDNDPLQFSLTAAPVGMSIDANTGLINWQPLNSGTFTVTVQVTDGQGGEDSQTLQLNTEFAAGALNVPPQLNSIGDQTVPVGSTLTLQLSAVDNNTVFFTAEPMPLLNGMALNSAQGLFTFTPSIDQIGTHQITLIADDSRFTDAETITITVPATDGVTRLQGTILTENAAPLAGVRLEMGGVETVTDSNGNFMLDNLPLSGDVRLLVDGSTVDPALGVFATVPEIIQVIEGADNQLEPAIILLPLDVASADPVNPATTSLITSSRVTQGLEISQPVTLTIPPGRAIETATGQPYVGDIHISIISDPTQGPRPLPDDIELSVYVAIQPFGVTYPDPVPISFPNLEGFPPGSLMDFFALNHETGVFEKIGEGTVSGDGKTIDSNGGIVKSNSWHGAVPQSLVSKLFKDLKNLFTCSVATDKPEACTFNTETGNLSETHVLPIYQSLQQPRAVQLEYHSVNANPRPIIPLESGFGNFAPPPETMSMRIKVGGIELGEELFSEVNVTPSNIRGQFELTRPAIQFDAMSIETGIYDYALTIDCHFPISRRSETINGNVIVRNESQSPFGAGWTLAGLQRLAINEQGQVLLSVGNEQSHLFTPINATQYQSPAMDYSTLIRLPDDSFQRTLKNGIVYHFDSEGKQISMTDRNGNVTVYSYDGVGRLELITDPVGKAYQFAYFSERIKSITDPENRITSFEHDSEGNLIAIIEPNGDKRTFGYEAGTHLMTAQTDQRDNRKEYSYDFAGRIASALLPDGSVNQTQPGIVKGLADPSTGLGAEDNPTPAPLLLKEVQNSYSDLNGNASFSETDPRNAPVKVTDAVGRTTLIERDNNSNPTKTTRPNLSQINRTYDAFGNVLTSLELFNNALNSFTYDAFNLVTSVTNANIHTTVINRDEFGNPKQIINHLGHTTTLTYDSRGLVTRIQDPNDMEITFNYNAAGLPETITETPPPASPGNVRITQLSYDAAGQNTQMITPDGIVLTMVYDSKGRLISITDNLNQTIAYGYDTYNNLISTDTRNTGGDLVLTAANAFDSRNRLVESRMPHTETEDSVVQRILDNNSNLIGITDPNGAVSSNSFDGEDRLTESTHRLNGITRYQYDTNNRITKVTAPNGVITEYTYDVLGRRLTETSADRGTLNYEYDKANNLTKVTDARDISIDLDYDVLERVTSKTYPNTIAGKNENVTYTYDTCAFGIGRLCARQDESGSDAFEYDAFGNPVLISHTELSVEYTTQYVFDDGDHVIQTTYPSGRVLDYSRDGVRRLQAIDTEVNGSAQNIIGGIQYRADNQMTQCTFGNNVIDQRSYDLQGRLTQQLLTGTGGSIIDQRNYSYDKNGNMLNRVTTPQRSDYQYDALDRLIGDTIDGGIAANFEYDLNGNRLTQTQTGSLQEIYTHTANSNRLEDLNIISTPAANAPTYIDRELIYNDAGRLYQLYQDGVLQAEYIYNDSGQRTRKIVHQAGGTIVTTVYHYDGMGYLISETDEAGNLIRDYIWSEAMHPVAQIDRIGAGERLSYLHTDHLMTNRLATDDNQAVVWRWKGKAFGKTAPDEIGGIQVNLRFPGQYFDQETGLFYNWNRYYDPGLGRYITSDPIGLSGGLGTFGYVQNNTLSSFDLRGLKVSDGFMQAFNFGRSQFAAGAAIITKIFVESPLETLELSRRVLFHDDCGENCLSEHVNKNVTRELYNAHNDWLGQALGDPSLVNNPTIIENQDLVGDLVAFAYDLASLGATGGYSLNRLHGYAKNSRYTDAVNNKWGRKLFFEMLDKMIINPMSIISDISAFSEGEEPCP